MITVDLCGNDEYGIPKRYLDRIQIGETELVPPGRVRWNNGQFRLRVGRYKFIKAGVNNYPHWSYVGMTWREVRKLYKVLRLKGWQCESGHSSVYNWMRRIPF